MGDKVFTMGDAGRRLPPVREIDRDKGGKLWAPEGRSDRRRRRLPGPPFCSANGEFVFGFGRDGDLVCRTAKDGEEVWRKDAKRISRAAIQRVRATPSQPLLERREPDRTPGGKEATMVARFEKKTGKVVWRGGNHRR